MLERSVEDMAYTGGVYMGAASGVFLKILRWTSRGFAVKWIEFYPF